MTRRISHVFINLGRGVKSLWRKYHFLIPSKEWKRYAESLWRIVFGDGTYFNPLFDRDYAVWVKKVEKRDIAQEEFRYKPLISVLIPVYNVKGKYLRECIESVLAQKYDNFEICLVDDKSSLEETLKVLNDYEKNEKVKIEHRKENGHISRATNDALAMAKGEFVALLDNDDVLDENALYEVATVLNKDKKIDFVYTDEDKIGMRGQRCVPHFKTDWAPDTFLSLNYICHLAVIRTKLVREVGGFTVGMEGAQDYDLFLKVTEKTKRIYHIPKILYHWRMTENSTAMKLDNKGYASDNGIKVIKAALERRGVDAEVLRDEVSAYYQVIYNIRKEPKVSVIIPIRDQAKVTERCLESIYEKTRYKNFEVIVVDNRSEEKETFELLKKYEAKHDNFRVIKADMEFNYSKINNLAVKKANGEVLILLNNDTEVITPEWMSYMVGYAMQPHVGAVGAKLLYPDKTVQHGGVVLGMGGVAGHVYLGVGRNDVGMYGRLRVPYDYGAVTAACLCVEKKKFLKVKGLEEKLEVAFNDIDFCIKLLEEGYYNVMLPMVELYHYESKSRGTDTTPGKRERFQKEVEFMQKKWGEKLTNDKYYNRNFSLERAFALSGKRKTDEK